MMIFHSFAVANDLIKSSARDDRSNGRRIFLPTNTSFEGICLALSSKFLQKELWILFVLKTIQ